MQTKGGRTIQCEHAVVTIPLGVLQVFITVQGSSTTAIEVFLIADLQISRSPIGPTKKSGEAL